MLSSRRRSRWAFPAVSRVRSGSLAHLHLAVRGAAHVRARRHLLTGYLGGAVASHLRLGDPIFTHTLFGLYLGLLAWGGLYLRDARLRALIPLRMD